MVQELPKIKRSQTKHKIGREGIGIASKLERDDRMETYAEREAKLVGVAYLPRLCTSLILSTFHIFKKEDQSCLSS